MLLNRSHVSWFWLTLLASVASVVLYLMVFHPQTLPFLHFPLPEWLVPKHRLHYSVGNSPLGLTYGIIAYAIFIFAVLLNVQKRFPILRLGRAQTWLRAHIWLTILTLPLVFMHAAFRFGGGMTSTLMWLYLLVMVSGFYGLGLQQFLPRIMKTRLTLETIYEEIPFLTQQLLTYALKMRDELRPVHAGAHAAAGQPAAAALPAEPPDPSVGAMLEALEHTVLPYLAARNPRRNQFNNPAVSTEFFRLLTLRTAQDQHGRVDLLASWCEERRQMDLQARYQLWLHGWLLVHVPASFLLLILTGWHAVVALVLY
jgi:hypothetical protein